MAKETLAPGAKIWKDRLSTAESNQASLFEAFKRWYQDFYGVFKENVAPWRSKVVDPKVAGKALSVMAKLALSDPQPNFRPRDPHDFLKARNNEELIRYQIENPEFDKSMFEKKYEVSADATICGLGLALIPWTIKRKSFLTRFKDSDGVLALDKAKKQEYTVAYNDFVPVSIFRFYVEPGATSLHSARWVIIKDYKTYDELKAINESKGVEIYKNLDQLKNKKGSGSSTTSDYETARNDFLSLTQSEAQDDTVGKFEIWLCYDKAKNELIELADCGRVMIRKQANPYWHGLFPGESFYIRRRPHDIWGDGLFERTERLAAANNALINHFLDGLDLSLNGMIIAREDSVSSFNIEPGGLIEYTGERPEPWKLLPPDAGTMQFARNFIGEAIEENTISQYAQGTPNSNLDKTSGTATGIRAIQDAANDMIRLFELTYAKSWERVYRQWLSNNQQFLDRSVWARVTGRTGEMPKEIKPEDIVTQGTLDVTIDVDAMRPVSKELQEAVVIEKLRLVMDLQKASLVPIPGEDGRALPYKPLKVNYALAVKAALGATAELADIIDPSSEANDSPSEENDLMLQGQRTEPTMNEDHATHLAVHLDLMNDEGVDEELKNDVIIPHLEAHKQFQAQQEQEREQQEVMDLQAKADATKQLTIGGRNANQTGAGAGTGTGLEADASQINGAMGSSLVPQGNGGMGNFIPGTPNQGEAVSGPRPLA